MNPQETALVETTPISAAMIDELRQLAAEGNYPNVDELVTVMLRAYKGMLATELTDIETNYSAEVAEAARKNAYSFAKNWSWN